MSLGIKLRVLFLHTLPAKLLPQFSFGLSIKSWYVCTGGGGGGIFMVILFGVEWDDSIHASHGTLTISNAFFPPPILTCPLCSEIPGGYTHLLHSKPRPWGSFFFVYFPSCFPDLLILIISFSSSVSLSPACSNLLLNHSGEFLNF